MSRFDTIAASTIIPPVQGFELTPANPLNAIKKLTLAGNIETLFANAAIVSAVRGCSTIPTFPMSAPSVVYCATTGYMLMVSMCDVDYVLEEPNKKAAEEEEEGGRHGGQ